MKKIRKIVIALALIVSIVTPSILSTNAVTAQAATITLSKKSLKLQAGKSAKLSVKGTKEKVTWKSNESKIATVTSNGTVKAIAEGSTKIVATVQKTELTCSVTVTPDKSDKTIEVEGYTLTYPYNYIATAKDIPVAGSTPKKCVYFALSSDPDTNVARIYLQDASQFGWEALKPYLKSFLGSKSLTENIVDIYKYMGFTLSDINVTADYEASYGKDMIAATYKCTKGSTVGKGVEICGMIDKYLYSCDVLDMNNIGSIKAVEKIYNSIKKK